MFKQNETLDLTISPLLVNHFTCVSMRRILPRHLPCCYEIDRQGNVMQRVPVTGCTRCVCYSAAAQTFHVFPVMPVAAKGNQVVLSIQPGGRVPKWQS